ncbi:IclR family transcriptional regulator [Dethiobacter alkaliphilus]|uniref:IclR family transcriptional regulator n=1 Tax=Dethiobacter alkaliphilus TaxID=427926 RepID=UPI0022268D13|nr:IclR family transcriptional regulator [Dethiobacter alkaliphilus]MCW3489579.1 IclR family transcriptional regulator [Dethiobacter alkaliphilus]
MEQVGVEKGQADGNIVQSVERALTLLEILADEGAPMAITDIAEKVNLKISTVHRLLGTLIYKGYVEKEPETAKYKLSLKLMSIGQSSVYPLDLRSKARPYLEELVKRCNETANLSILDGGEVVYIDQVESTNIVIVKMFSTIGSRRQAHCTGSGKVMLAHLPADELEKTLATMELKRYTNETITDVEILRKELERVRKQGYALDMGEREREMRCVAAPVRKHDGEVIAAISVSGPSSRITSYYLNNELIEIVQDVAEKLSMSLSWDGKTF